MRRQNIINNSKFKINLSQFHVLTYTFICLYLLLLAFLTQNPIILLSIQFFIILIFIITKNFKLMINGFKIFLPLFFVTLFINVLFSAGGNEVLFSIYGKTFTLEALIYAAIFCLRLIDIIYIFLLVSILSDSDKAASYFSSIMPKSTLMLMIAFKLIPNMNKRFKDLKDIYSIRGINFDSQKLKHKIIGYIPILSVLLENSLEGAFDIGESVYLRGFLSGKRSDYDNKRISIKDKFIIITCILSLIFYSIIKIIGLDNYNPYMEINIQLNTYNIISLFLILLLFFIIIIAAKENYNEYY